MLELYFSYLRLNGLFPYILEFLICYNLYQLLKQEQLVYVLGYKFIILIYIGWLMLYYDLDIAAFILWMVYGGFIVIVFVMSFMWLEITQQHSFIDKANWLIKILLVIFIYLIFFNSIFSFSELSFTDLWQISWINYYELIYLENEEELEILGWGIGVENILALLYLSLAFTMVCLCVISIIGNSKKNKALIYFNLTQNIFKMSRLFNYIYLRTQNFYAQEYKMIGVPTKHFKLFHRRRI